jgi:hypothetical protein
MKSLNLKSGISNHDKKGYDELLALAISFHDYQSLDPGDLVWAKITGIVYSCSQLLTDYLCFCLIYLNLRVIVFLFSSASCHFNFDFYIQMYHNTGLIKFVHLMLHVFC